MIPLRGGGGGGGGGGREGGGEGGGGRVDKRIIPFRLDKGVIQKKIGVKYNKFGA